MDNLRKWMEQNGVTQEWLAAEVGVAQGTVSNWLVGRFKPEVRTLLEIADVTGLTLDQLLDRDAA